LRFVFRNFPLTDSHPHALHAAEAAECAAVQGKFWEMHDKLFENQKKLDDRHLVKFAREIGLDEARFVAEMETNGFQDRVQEHFSSGLRSGVHGTPTFFINGARYDQAWDLES